MLCTSSKKGPRHERMVLCRAHGGAQASVSWRSGGSSQRQIVPQDAPRLGQASAHPLVQPPAQGLLSTEACGPGRRRARGWREVERVRQDVRDAGPVALERAQRVQEHGVGYLSSGRRQARRVGNSQFSAALTSYTLTSHTLSDIYIHIYNFHIQSPWASLACLARRPSVRPRRLTTSSACTAAAPTRPS